MSTDDAEGNPESGPPFKPLTREERTELLDALLARHASQLSEHFSSVQIIATNLEEDGATRLFNRGSGDFYARLGATADWVREKKRQKGKGDE